MKQHTVNTPRYLFIFSLFLSIFLGLIFYNSSNGTDFNRYYRYIDYFLGNSEFTSREQGVFYFWTVYKTSELLNVLLQVNNFQSIVPISIQISNIVYYLFGILGFFKLLKFYDFQSSDIYIALSFLNFFPPIFGARLIMKPEILAFSFLPWILYLIETYLDSKQLQKLLYLTPLISLGLTSKAFITASIALLVIIKFINKIKEFEKVHLFYFSLASLILCFLIFYNDYRINNVGFLYHELVAQYNFKASLNLIYNLDLNLFINSPFRDNMRNSFLGITLIDLFGDYFERYWDHSRSLFFESRVESKKYNLNMFRRYMSVILSFLFLFYSLFPIKNNKFKLYIRAYLLGIFLILCTAYGFFGTYFNPDKGDTLKTHYYSHLLALSFLFMIIQLIQKRKLKIKLWFLFFYTFVVIFIFGFPWSIEIFIDTVNLSGFNSYFQSYLI